MLRDNASTYAVGSYTGHITFGYSNQSIMIYMFYSYSGSLHIRLKLV
jgi:hypothetical protein